MTENYKDFLKWATPQITVDQYQTLCKILYSFKEYKETDEPGILNGRWGLYSWSFRTFLC